MSETRGGQKNRTEPKSISNHPVEDFSNLHGSVWFGFKPNRETDVFCNYLN